MELTYNGLVRLFLRRYSRRISYNNFSALQKIMIWLVPITAISAIIAAMAVFNLVVPCLLAIFALVAIVTLAYTTQEESTDGVQ